MTGTEPVSAAALENSTLFKASVTTRELVVVLSVTVQAREASVRLTVAFSWLGANEVITGRGVTTHC